jgi:hypothetical protein
MLLTKFLSLIFLKPSPMSLLKKSYLSDLYVTQPLSLLRDIEEYVLSPRSLDSELGFLEEYAEGKEPDLTRMVFIIEILSKSIRKHSEFRDYMRVLVKIMEKYGEFKYSIFCLRIIKSIVGTKFYLPLSFYILRILRNALDAKSLVLTNKAVDYDCVKPSADRIRSEEHQLFVIQECRTLLIKHLSAFSRNIGFPELSLLVIEELIRLRAGLYKELIDDVVLEIKNQREHVLRRRNKAKLSALDTKNVLEFEKSLENRLED